MPQTPSTRWCPTPEQLMILEELYRSGVKTPNATQIQQITAHLSLYGKIEGKNVFYWFQNHKARERQKLRRKLSRQQQQQQISPDEAGPASPSAPSLQYQMTPHFLQQGFVQETTNPGMNMMGKLETAAGTSQQEQPTASSSTDCSTQWMASMNLNNSTFQPCCRPLKTLDLFPMTGTSMKDECSSSKSSSCSTSTN